MKCLEMRRAPAGRGPRLQKPVGPPGLRTLIAMLAVVLAIAPSCRRKETPGTAASATPAPEATPVVEREETPIIRAAALPGLPPFDGLREPRDGAVDDNGRIWIADFGHSRLRLFDRNGGALGGWGGRGNGTFGFRDLSGVAVRKEDLYVADTWNGRVQHFTTAGAWKGSSTGMFGPRGVAVGPDGRVWVTDTGNHQVRVYDAALGRHETIGKRGSGPSEFASPVGICVGRSGDVFVADTGNRRVVVLDSSGRFKSSFSFPGWEQAVEPHLEVDDDGSVFVTDPESTAEVIHFDPRGRILERWSTASNGENLSLPSGLAFDRGTRTLYVINRGNGRVSRIAVGAGGKS
jgi:tripartite motif-containing protein 71